MYDENGIWHQPDPRMDAMFSNRGDPFGTAMDVNNVNQSYLNYQLARGDKALSEYEKARAVGMTPGEVSAAAPTSRIAEGYPAAYASNPAAIAREEIGKLDRSAPDYMQQAMRISVAQGLEKPGDISRFNLGAQRIDARAQVQALRDTDQIYKSAYQEAQRQGIPLEYLAGAASAAVIGSTAAQNLPEVERQRHEEAAAALPQEWRGVGPRIQAGLELTRQRTANLEQQRQILIKRLEDWDVNFDLRKRLIDARVPFIEAETARMNLLNKMKQGGIPTPEELGRLSSTLSHLLKQREELEGRHPLDAIGQAKQRTDLKSLNSWIASLQGAFDAGKAILSAAGPAAPGTGGGGGLTPEAAKFLSGR